MKVLDLFSGIGGFSYGLDKVGFKTVAFCEMDKYCKLVLQKHWKGVKIYNDVKEITKARFETDGIEFPEVITGGFPCQPFSVAGKQKGTSDDRYLWPEMFRIIKEFKPRWVIGENVRGIVNIQDGVVFETVCTDLESEGYEVQAFNIPAAGVGAPHRRERIWIVAHSNDTRNRTPKYETNENGQKISERRQEQSQLKSSGHSENVGYSKHDGSSTSKIERGDNEINARTQKRSNSSSEFKRTSGSRNNEDVANSRRTLRQGTELREKNEDETRKENANQHQRSSGSSESNVANTNSRLSDRENEEVQSRGQTSDTSGEGSTDVANTERKRLEGLSEQSSTIGKQDERLLSRNESSGDQTKRTDVANTESKSSNSEHNGKESRETSEQEQIESRRSGSWSLREANWIIEPDVGRVAHGVPGRVHRLKALGNSIVPKIAEEIGKAIVEADDIEYQSGGAYKAMLKLFRDNLK